MSEISGQIPLAGFDEAPGSTEKPEPATPTMSDDRVSEAFYDLGGHPHELTADEAYAMYQAGLGGVAIGKQVARNDAATYYQEEFNLTGPIAPTDEQRNINERGMQAVARVLAIPELDRVSKDAAGDKTRQVALQRARMEKREKARGSRS